MVDDYCVKALRALRPAPVEPIQPLEESDSDCQVKMVAFTAPQEPRLVGEGGNFQRKSGGVIAHHLVQDWVKDLVVDLVHQVCLYDGRWLRRLIVQWIMSVVVVLCLNTGKSSALS